MPNDQQIEIAGKFAELALAKMPWDEVGELSEEGVAVLFRLVEVAGFEPKVLKREWLATYTWDGVSRGVNSVNELCPYMVVGVGEEDHFPATRWLDEVLQYVVIANTVRGESVQVIAMGVALEIERSVPLPPIMLTHEGDMLEEHPPSGMGIGVEHTRDANPLSDAGGCVGIHRFCHGFVDRHRATESRDTLVCRKCHLRVYIPRTVTTYGELRRDMRIRWGFGSSKD